jgi:hypothetical protein
MKISDYKKLTKKPSKYNNTRVFYDSIWFDSEKECERYKELKLLEKAGKISNLAVHFPFLLIPGVYYNPRFGNYDFSNKKLSREWKCVQRPIVYIADFVYDTETERIVEDVKGCRNKRDAAYKKFLHKKRLMKIVWNVDVKEV